MSVADPSLIMFTTHGPATDQEEFMTTLSVVDTTRSASATLVRPGIAITRLHNNLWRITRPAGDVLGYVESFPTAAGERYRAKRLVARQGRFLVDGEFWSMNDAVECLH
jgi:hypothetical protein